MAKMNPNDPKYGVSVSARVGVDIASELRKGANKLGLTMSKYLGMVISESVIRRLNDESLHDTIEELEQKNKKCNKKLKKAIKAYNRVDERRKNEVSFLVKKLCSDDEERARYIKLINNQEY